MGVRAELLPLYERDLPVSQLVQVGKRHADRRGVIQLEIGDVLHPLMAGDSNDGDGQTPFERRIDRNQSFNGSREQQPGIVAQQVGAMMMAYDKIEVAGLQQSRF